MQDPDTYERLTECMSMSVLRMPEILSFLHFPVPIRMLLPKVWHSEESKENLWTVPYLPIDPKDVGRNYDSDVIRINSQSGKGGVAYVLKQNYGLEIPDRMREEVGYLMKGVSDHAHAELSPEDMLRVFEETYSQPKRSFAIAEATTSSRKMVLQRRLTFEQDGKKRSCRGKGKWTFECSQQCDQGFLR